ncbi:MAG: serine protease [Deltaproteobacteria bacterium]|nr:MAG: serine protease [Deltaproteobacteria bacterium]
MNTAAVVRIYCTSLEPDYDAPWQALTPNSGTGSGVAIAANRVLTGAHVVADATFVQVQKVDDPTRYTARLVALCHDADLALLEIDEPAFAKGIEPAELGELPELRDRVSVVGFPVGGHEVSVTEGVVSRIELQRYSHSQRRLLALTVDAAINSGNSGGPVFAGDKVVGIAFQSLRDAENIGEVVPSVLVARFLRGVKEGRPLGVPSLSVRVQGLENPVLRQRLGMREDQTGVRVRGVEFGGAGDGVLEVGDVLLALDGHDIANNGTVRWRGLRTTYPVVLSERFIGDPVPVRLLRDGVEREVTVTLGDLSVLAERSQYDVRPRYIVYGGLVFQPLSRDFLATWKTWWEKAPSELVNAYHNELRREGCHERVVLSRILADELTIGYTDRRNEFVERVDGVAVQSLAHLGELLDRAGDRVELETSWGAVLVFDTAAVRAGQSRILANYRIAAARSQRL